MALATGSLIALLFPPLLVFLPFLGIIFFLVYQIIIYRHFWGKRRGDFEYASKEKLIKKGVDSIVRKNLGIGPLILYKIDLLNSIVTSGWDVHKKLVKLSKNKDDIFNYYLNFMGANLSQKDGDVKNERLFLLNAAALKPNDLILCYRLGVTFERDGQTEDSLNYYHKALNAPLLESKELKKFINSQINRLTEKGPQKSPPMPGLRFMTW